MVRMMGWAQEGCENRMLPPPHAQPSTNIGAIPKPKHHVHHPAPPPRLSSTLWEESLRWTCLQDFTDVMLFHEKAGVMPGTQRRASRGGERAASGGVSGVPVSGLMQRWWGFQVRPEDVSGPS